MGYAQTTEYKNKFLKEKYDRLNIQVPKGSKEKIEQHRKEKGFKSLNAYVLDLIDKDMNNSKNIIIGEISGGNNTISIE